MKIIFEMPLFWIFFSLISFEIGIFLYKKTKIAILNPLLTSVFLIIIFMFFYKIDLVTYQKGGDLIQFFLGPATVILAVPLYKKQNLLKKHYKSVFTGIFTGTICAVITVFIFSKLLNLDDVLTISILPKSITAPIGMELSKQLGGVVSITIASIVLTGITGAVIAPITFKIFKIKSKIAKGIAIGTASHAVGTSKAVEMGEIEGAMSGLSIGVAGLVTVLIVPLIAKFI